MSYKKLILHIPHSSPNIPSDEGYVVNKNLLEAELIKLTDWYTDELFQSSVDHVVKADFSRIFCDPERFENDEEEVMAKFGMGVLYTTTDSGRKLREVSDSQRESILNKYYRPHHEKLTSAVQEGLEEAGEALILDCHSFASQPFERDLDQSPKRPDFSIGIDPYHTPQELAALSVSFFKERGFSVKINKPYEGTIVPLKYYQNRPEVKSIMLEINRDLYLEPGSKQKNSSFEQIKSLVQAYLDSIRSF